MFFLTRLVFKFVSLCTNHQQQSSMTTATSQFDCMTDSNSAAAHQHSAEVAMSLTFPPKTVDVNAVKLSADIYYGAWKEEALSRNVNVLRTIYSKQDLAIIHCQCSRYGDFCIKLRYPFSGHEMESAKYVDMLAVSEAVDRGAASYFPEVFAFIKVKMLRGEVWGGICMKLMGQPLVDILFVDSIPKRQAENVKNLAKLSAEFWKVPLVTDSQRTRDLVVYV